MSALFQHDARREPASMSNRSWEVPIQRASASVYVIPTDAPESDGTLEWDHTTLVLAHVSAGNEVGMGYTYGSGAAAGVIEDVLQHAIRGRDALAIPASFAAMRRAIRNLGPPGVAFTAISAVDAALWDLKGKLLKLPVVRLLGSARDAVPLYGSGGFTSYDERRLCEQLSGWIERGFRFVKMKIGRDAKADRARVKAVRHAIGAAPALFVDANGAYDRKLGLEQSFAFAEYGVCWFEEPVSSEDLEGLHFMRERCPAGMEIAAGEYGYTPAYFHAMLAAGSVDVLQADATRCGGITGMLQVGPLVAARSMDLSAQLRAGVACARRLRERAHPTSRVLSRSRADREAVVRRLSRA